VSQVRHLGIIFDCAAIFIAADMKLFTPAASWVERTYSNGFYPRADTAIRSLTQPAPFAVGDALAFVVAVALISWWIDRFRRAARERSFAIAGKTLLRTVSILALLYIWFMVAWGYNYERVPVAAKILLHNERTNEDSVNAYADHVVDELNANADGAHAAALTRADVIETLTPTFTAAIKRLGDEHAFAPAPVKPTIFQFVMSASANDGFMDPWTHEINIDATTFTFERPAIYAHEWAHLSGFADESEANLIATLACINSAEPLLRYSGWILVWSNLPSNVKVTRSMNQVPYDDIMAIRARMLRQANPTVEKVQRTAYNAYLKANHVKAGYASYEYFIRWLTSADFDANGLPLVRPGVAST
jgi:hypothetical protein